MTKGNKMTQEGLDKIGEILEDAKKIASSEKTLSDYSDLQDIEKATRQAGKVARKVLNTKENAALAGDLYAATSTGRSIYVPDKDAKPSEKAQSMISTLVSERKKKALASEIRAAFLERADRNKEEREDISNITTMTKDLKFLLDSLNTKDDLLEKAKEEKKVAVEQKIKPIDDELEDINLNYRDAISDLCVAIINLRRAKTHLDTSNIRYNKAVDKYKAETAAKIDTTKVAIEKKKAELKVVNDRLVLESIYRENISKLIKSIEETTYTDQDERKVNKEYLKALKNELSRVDNNISFDRERYHGITSDINALNEIRAAEAEVKPVPETPQPDHICKLSCRVDFWNNAVKKCEGELAEAQKVANDWLFKKLEKEKDLNAARETLKEIIERVENIEGAIVETTKDADTKSAEIREYITQLVEPRDEPTNNAIRDGMIDIFGELNKLEEEDVLDTVNTTLNSSM